MGNCCISKPSENDVAAKAKKNEMVLDEPDSSMQTNKILEDKSDLNAQSINLSASQRSMNHASMEP